MLSGSAPPPSVERSKPRPPQIAAVPPPERVDDVELDQLRAELVRELDGRAARDGGGSATFRRVA
jgi:hypothetical protein